MNIEPTNEADVVCKDLIGEAYEEFHLYIGSSGLDKLWDKVEEALKYDLSTSGDEDNKAMDILNEVFEKACRTADEEGRFDFGSGYVDYKALWERLCAVLEVKV